MEHHRRGTGELSLGIVLELGEFGQYGSGETSPEGLVKFSKSRPDSNRGTDNWESFIVIRPARVIDSSADAGLTSISRALHSWPVCWCRKGENRGILRVASFSFATNRESGENPERSTPL